MSLTTWLKREGFGTYATIDEFVGELARRSTSALGGLGASLAAPAAAAELGELAKGNGLNVCVDVVRDLRVPKGARVACLRAVLTAGVGAQAARLFAGAGDLVADARLSEADRGYLIRSGLKALLEALPPDGLNLELAKGAFAAQEAVKAAEAGGVVREVVEGFPGSHTGVLTVRHAAFDAPMPVELATRWQDIFTRQLRAARNAPPAARRLGTAPEWPPVVPDAFRPLLKQAETLAAGPSTGPATPPVTGPSGPNIYETRSGAAKPAPAPTKAEPPAAAPAPTAAPAPGAPPAPPEAPAKAARPSGASVTEMPSSSGAPKPGATMGVRRPTATVEYGPRKVASPTASAAGIVRPRAVLSEGAEKPPETPSAEETAGSSPAAPLPPVEPKVQSPIRPRPRGSTNDVPETYVADTLQVHPASLRSPPSTRPPQAPIPLNSLRFGEQVDLVARRGTRASERLVAAFDVRAGDVGYDVALRELEKACARRGTEGVNGAMLDELHALATDPKTPLPWRQMLYAVLRHLGPDRAAAIELAMQKPIRAVPAPG